MISNKFRARPDVYALLNVRVIDGDTIEATIPLPFDTQVRKRIRLKDWWAHELSGPHASQGAEAKQRLERFIEEKAIWLFSASCRLDKYGRVIGTLMHQERIITAREVLGDLQLTREAHKAASDAQKAIGRPRQGERSDSPGFEAAGPL